MKNMKTMAFIAVLAAVPACTVCGKVTASRDYVDEKVAQATNSVMNEVEGKLSSATPSDYETVSNRAMNAVQFELDVNSNRTALTVGIDRQREIGSQSVVFGAISSATGSLSFAHGYGASAYGENSHAEGNSTYAVGDTSHAEGNASRAEGGGSHAEGLGTLTRGLYSHAEGMGAEAHGRNSHAEGSWTKAFGEGSHAEGSNTVASNNYAHAEGYFTRALGRSSHAGGSYACANDDYSYVWGGNDGFIARQVSKGDGTFNVYPRGGIGGFYVAGFDLDTLIREGSAVTSVNSKKGEVSLTADDVGALPVDKDGTFTIGGSGKTSLKIGGSYIYPGELTVSGVPGRRFHVKEDGPYYGSCEISGSKISLKSAGGGLSEYASMIEMPFVSFSDRDGYHKYFSDILLNGVSVWGSLSNLNSYAAIAEKDSSGGRTAFMFGALPTMYTNRVNGAYSLSQGFGTFASNMFSHAEGYDTYALGMASHAEGCRANAIGDYSHAEGGNTVASGLYSHADGIRSVASNDFSYVWSGSYDFRKRAGSNGDGTYSIYPVGGTSGFYVDGKSLDAIIAEGSSVTKVNGKTGDVKLDADDLGAWDLTKENSTTTTTQSVVFKNSSGENAGMISMGILGRSGTHLVIQDNGLSTSDDATISSIRIYPSRISLVDGDTTVNMSWKNILTKNSVQQMYQNSEPLSESPVSSAAVMDYWENFAAPDIWETLDTKVDEDYVSTAVETALAPYAKTADIPVVPTKVSELTNDAGFVKADALPVTLGGGSGNLGAVAIGLGADATEKSLGISVAIGNNAKATGMAATAVGSGATATDRASTSIGTNAKSHGVATFNVTALNPSMFYLGDTNLQTFIDAALSGYATTAALAPYAKKTDLPTIPTAVSSFTNDAGYLKKDSQVVIGEGSSVSGNDMTSIVIGYNALSLSDDSGGEIKPRESNICIGSLAGASGKHAVAIGPSANAYNGSVAIGSMAGVGESSYSAVAIGMGAKFNGDRTVTLGTVSSLDNLYLGDLNLKALIGAEISQSNETFSNAVLAVGLNIDTNSVAVLNEIASTFGGFPVEGTATTVGGLLAALAAAIAWLKRNKADKADVDALAAKVGNANARLEEVA